MATQLKEPPLRHGFAVPLPPLLALRATSPDSGESVLRGEALTSYAFLILNAVNLRPPPL